MRSVNTVFMIAKMVFRVRKVGLCDFQGDFIVFIIRRIILDNTVIQRKKRQKRLMVRKYFVNLQLESLLNMAISCMRVFANLI